MSGDDPHYGLSILHQGQRQLCLPVQKPLPGRRTASWRSGQPAARGFLGVRISWRCRRTVRRPHFQCDPDAQCNLHRRGLYRDTHHQPHPVGCGRGLQSRRPGRDFILAHSNLQTDGELPVRRLLGRVEGAGCRRYQKPGSLLLWPDVAGDRDLLLMQGYLSSTTGGSDPFRSRADQAMAELKVKTPPLRPEAQAATATVPQDSFLRVQHAEALRLHGRFDQAQAICESLLRSNPDYVAALHTLGLVLADQERHRDALSYLVRAVMLNPLGWTALTALAGVYLRLGAIGMAAQTVEQAIAIEPGDAGVHLMLGDIRREQCEYEIARDAYRRALTIDPGMVEAEIGMGWCCAE